MRYRSQLRFLLEGVEGVGVFLVVFLSWPLSKRWLENWGSVAAERERAWTGDEFAPSSHDISTRAVDVAAGADAVWPWIVQFGLGRAGFYSYELLERVVGIPVKNVESVVEEFQTLDIGDEIKLHPTAPGIPIVALERGRHICFGQPADAPVTADPDPLRSWSIYLDPQSSQSCRLVLRGCVEELREPTALKRLGLWMGQPIDFVMEQRMLRTIRRLAESSDSGSGDPT